MNLNYENVSKLAEKYGDSFYLLDSEKFRMNLREMREAFQKYYSSSNIAYSFKTNYTPKLCKIVKEEGAYAEVVSDLEYELARKLGFLPNKIYYNGPYKKKEKLCEYILEGANVNLDTYQEFESIRELSKRTGQPIQFGIRCNFDIDNGKKSRFGFDIDGYEFKKMMNEIEKSDNLIVKGFQCHFPERRLDWYENRVKGMIRILDQYMTASVQYISFGGGYFGKINNQFAQSFSAPIPQYEDYAIVIAKKMKEYFDKRNMETYPELLIEPGSAVVADTMRYVTRIIGIKNVRGRNIASSTGSSYNMNPSVKSMNRPITVLRQNKSVNLNEQIWDIVGYTCIEDDLIYHAYKGNLDVGNFVIFDNVGSYSIVFKPAFILPQVPVIDVVNNRMEIVKRGEKFEDIFQTYNF